MQLNHIAAMTFNHVMGRLARRAVLAAVMVAFAIVALYQITVAGILALEPHFASMQAHLIVAAVYGALALVCLTVLWATRSKPAAIGTPPPAKSRDMQIAMLIEAVMLGYTLARKSNRARD